MCGILGILHYRDLAPVDVHLLVRMRDRMSHRGPDDAGLWLSAAGNCGLAHRRLSIIDLTPDGHQPMSNEQGTIWITFNGEIYNYRELRAELVSRGHQFRSHSDTETIIHLYEELGEACVERLDGMFAFGLWDESQRSLLLARDRAGVKPLYYCDLGGTLLFASEIKALCEHPGVHRELNQAALLQYLTFKTTPAPQTLFHGINKLPNAHLLKCDNNGHISSWRYWDAAQPKVIPVDGCNEAAESGKVLDLLNAAVAKRMIADVPVGVFLSGGLDSSAIVALMAQNHSGPINTFSIGIKDLEGHNELHYARQVAQHFGANHHELLIGKDDIAAYLPKLAVDQDEPLADPVSVPLHYLSECARTNNTKVVQVGEGSDELFFGYESRVTFLQSYFNQWRWLLALPRVVLQGMYIAASLLHLATDRFARQRDVFGKAARGDELFWGSVAFREQDRQRYFAATNGSDDRPSQALLNEFGRSARLVRPNADIATRMIDLDLKLRLAELLLMRVDKVTMASGIEARVPFLDYHLVEYAMSLPWQLKLRGWEPKYLLKKAFAGLLPENIIRRPKQPFAAPIGEWIRQGMLDFARQVILDSKLRKQGLLKQPAVERMLTAHAARAADHGVEIWTLMNLSAWYDHWME